MTLTKPPDTGGLVTPATVGEQILYEIGDPSSYLLPDVTCDWTGVTLDQAGEDRVSVLGARGRAPSDHYKVSATWADGFRTLSTVMVGGIDAGRKAERIGAEILKRVSGRLAETNLGHFRQTSIEVIGAEGTYGAHARAASRDVVLKIAVQHDRKEAVEVFAKEVAPAATSFAPGITGFHGGRPRAIPVVRLFSCLVPNAGVPSTVDIDGDVISVSAPSGMAEIPSAGSAAGMPADTPNTNPRDTVDVPLIALAHGRSGDKGNHANIGVIARDPSFVPVLWQALTPAAVADWFAHVLEDPSADQVERFELPGLNAFNFLLKNALGGGGIASLRYDPQGKAFAQMLLDMPIAVPAKWVAPGGPLEKVRAAA